MGLTRLPLRVHIPAPATRRRRAGDRVLPACHEAVVRDRPVSRGGGGAGVPPRRERGDEAGGGDGVGLPGTAVHAGRGVRADDDAALEPADLDPVRPAAAAARMDHGSLRKHVSVLSSSPAGSGAAGKASTGGGPPTISINVEGPWTRAKVQTAANSLAHSLIDYANRYTTMKTNLISGRVKTEQAEMRVLQEVQKRAHANLQSIDSSSAAPLDKVAASSPFVSHLSSAADQIGTLTLNLTNDQVALVAARDIESSQFISHAVGHQVSAATRRSSLIIAAMVGLIVGIGLALAWEALSARPRRAQA